MKNFAGIRTIAGKDFYKIREYHQTSFDYVIDIGANVGQFTLMSYILFPYAKIISYEPCIETYKVLCENMADLPVVLINKAVGDGQPLYFKPSGSKSLTCVGNLFKKNDTGNYKIESVTVETLFKYHDIDTSKNILMKINCEGGEQYILQDKYKDILLKCKHLAMDLHFQCDRNRNFDDFPEWSEYNNWIQKIFKSTHSILYHFSSKKRGRGVYVIRKEIK